ncbi:hypothetical protein GKZ68_12200 [Hymenobacter sp. BRD128]|uniref:hypothetical protein n=1 Tax=Hymenobacter sp. BRD128 TaxID=2675878 RepID=UPI0015663847|nr:hypothetical protein [Hymenobacter sp. BRD128]QKG57314.1 hypothetical protein GKZ68_12200 [Hymenobacter sp. BRD128]
MPSLNDQPNEIAGNHPSQPATETAKMGADAQNTNANSALQPATPAMQAGEPAVTPPPSSKELFDSEIEAGKGAVEQGGEQENREAQPADLTAAPPATTTQPNAYGGNFGNDVQNSYRDAERASNQRADANRGEFGEQGALGATHGGFGNQYREFDTAAERPGAEATEEKYYGEGASAPGPQHNAYRTYDGQDRRPDEQGHAVRDTPAPATRSFGDNVADRQPTDGRGNAQDNRNLPDKSGEVAAFQNDNGAPTSGSAYAPDYGHTSGVGLPAGATENHVASGLAGRNQQEDQHSSRGGYDNQGSQGGRSHDQQPGGNAPAGQGAAAPVNSPDALQNPGYGYGHERSEEAQPGNPSTGDSRNGFGASGSKEGNTSQGYGSKGGSYDDQNPGARGPEYDNFTYQDKAQNYGQENRPDFRPADGDQPKDADDTAPRRNAGRDEPAQ